MCFKSGGKQLPTHCEIVVVAEVTAGDVDVTARGDVERATVIICQVFCPYIVVTS